MKLSNKPILVIATLLGMVLSGCGKSNNNNAAGAPVFNGGLGTVPGTVFPGTPGGCYPINQGTIPFILQGARIDSANIFAQQGQMVIGGAGAATGGTMFISNQERVQQFGSSMIAMSVAPMGNGMYSGQGIIQLNQAVIQQIMMAVGGYGGYGQIPCVTGLALNAGHNNERLYNGRLYLYLAVNGQTIGTYTVTL